MDDWLDVEAMHGRKEMMRKILAGMSACLLAGVALAGDLTTDNLTVNQAATFNGNVTIVSPGTGSAPTNGLVLYYSFTTNTTPVPDESGNGNTGTVYGSATWVTNGKSGGAMSFGGWANSRIDIPPSDSIYSANEHLTMNAWYCPEDVGDKNYVIVMFGWQYWGAHLVLSSPDARRLMGGFAIGGGGYYSSAYDQTMNQWHMATCVRDGTTGYLYLDGTLVDTFSVGSGNLRSYQSGEGVGIGNAPGSTDTSSFSGSLDEVRIYNRALSASEIRGLYYYDAHLVGGDASFETGVKYVKPLGDLSMGSYTNQP